MTTFDNSCNKEDINAGVSTSHLEDYREQYHYSVPSGWGNDPNGMVYFNGEWHLFYQYYPDGVAWGPMHWAQAVSTDLVHWKDLGIAIEPGDVNPGDGQKYIFSGSAVVDNNNTSGFFDGIEGGGLVAAYTEDNNVAGTQQQSIAYSKDNGRTWTKYNNGDPVLTNAMDSLKSSDFRDPKIFWSEDANEWMMVVAGGPLRFFSSKDLKTWKAEGTQSGITTECPDLFKLQVGDTGTYKWVLSEGGRYYRVGDFKQVDGVWNFVPDNDEHLAMNFAPDAYAAQTYYGTGENGTPDGRRIMIQWMNNWNYAGSIGKITQTFNGQYTLQNELKLVQTTGAAIRLTQEPIKEYESLRQAPTIFNNVTISPNTPNVMSNLSGSQYEIVSEFTPDAKTTEVGFNLRVGTDEDQKTVVKYNTKTGEVTIDRSKSGKAPSSSFKDPSVGKVTKTADGKIQLHIFVDASSVEVYANNGEITGANQIFPNRTSQGIEVYSVGGNTQATIQYYPLSGIWNNDIKGTNSVALSLSESNFTKEVGEQFSIYTTTIPTTAAQGVTWSISDPSVVKIISQDDTKTTFEVTGTGNTDLTATSKDGKLKKTASLGVYNRNITSDISDLTDFQSTTGNWFVNNNAYTSDARGIGDGFVTSGQMNDDLTATYTYSADAKFVSDGKPLTDGVASLVLFSQTRDASKGSLVANILWNGEYRVFNFPGGQNVASGKVDVDPNGVYHLKSEIKGNHIKYWINDKLVCDADEQYTTPGYFGLNTCNAEVEYTNIRLNKVASDTSTLELNKTAFEQSKGDTFTIYSNQEVNWSIADPNVVQVISKDANKTTFEVVNAGATTLTATSATNTSLKQNVSVEAYERNPETVDGLVEGLTNFQTHNGNWYVKNDAYEVNVSGDGFSTSDTKIDLEKNPDTTYTLEADANILSGDVAELVLFAQSKANPQGDGSLIANVIRNNTYNLFTFGKGGIKAGDLDDSGKSTDGKYHLKAEVKGTHLKYTINNQVIYDGEQNFFTSGYMGLGACNANVAFTNIKFTDDTTLGGSTDTTGAAVTVTTGAAITVAAPVTGETPVSTIDETDQYTATIEWSENPAIFEANKVYTAKITIKPKAGYTVIGVPKDYFKVEGAIATNNADSGVITAVFPETN
jgi:fructan beta-fructosidase